jgi:DNA invertase Pin-like site-specific DNA recombinase
MSIEMRSDEPEISRRRLSKSQSRTRLMDGGITPQDYGPGTPVAIYIRVSSEEQLEGFSMSAQERACREFANKRNWIVHKVYDDPGHSGKNDQRPGFQIMIANARQHAFKAILVHKLDRFSRHIDSTLKYFRELNDLDITITSVTEDFDYSTPMGRMFFRMMAVFAQWYLENLSAETVKGKMERVKKGKHNGRLAFGYTPGPIGIAVQVPDEADAVRRAFEMYSTGEYTDRQLAHFFNEEGFDTRRRRHWSKDTIRGMLNNEFYYGKVAYREKLLPGKHEPIISKELFDTCQEERRKHSHMPKSHTPVQKKVYLLQRLIRCNSCGRHLRMQSSKNHYYYKEASFERGFECDDGGFSIRMDEADEQVLACLRALHLPKDWQDKIETDAMLNDDVQKVADKREQIQDNLRRLARAFADGGFSEQEYEDKRSGWIVELENHPEPNKSEVLSLGLQLEDINAYLIESDETEKSELTHILLTAVYADLASGRIVRLKPAPEFIFMFRMAAQRMGWREDDGAVFRI